MLAESRTAFAPDPASGRIYSTSRTVRTTDVTPAGRLRLDAVARYLQEAAEDDITDAGWDEPYDWLLRRCALTILGFSAHGDRVSLRTFCSGLGPRWAERTTTLSGANGDLIQARAVWVAVARDTGSPAPLSPEFRRVYGPSAQDRKVSARLSHPGPNVDDPPGRADRQRPAQGADGARSQRPWQLRASDFDTAGHVNNTVHWAAAEDALAGLDWLPASAELEYHQPILPGCEPCLVVSRSPGGLDLWLMTGPDRLASARLTR
jgi:acyl-ACP thioesterase